MPEAEKTIFETIRTLLSRRGSTEIKVLPNKALTDDLGLDSLEIAELSAVLEDELGRDPFSEGIFPDTVEDLIRFYDPT